MAAVQDRMRLGAIRKERWEAEKAARRSAEAAMLNEIVMLDEQAHELEVVHLSLQSMESLSALD
eukprot:432623-Prymnesium_polylepis.1